MRLEGVSFAYPTAAGARPRPGRPRAPPGRDGGARRPERRRQEHDRVAAPAACRAGPRARRRSAASTSPTCDARRLAARRSPGCRSSRRSFAARSPTTSGSACLRRATGTCAPRPRSAGADRLRLGPSGRLRHRRRRRRPAALGRRAAADRPRARVPPRCAARDPRRADRRTSTRRAPSSWATRSSGFAAGRTVLLIAHRPELAARADRIVHARTRPDRRARGGGGMTGDARAACRLRRRPGPPCRARRSALGVLAVGFGVGLMTSAGYLISRAAEQPPILALTVDDRRRPLLRPRAAARPLPRARSPRTTSRCARSAGSARASTSGSSRSRPPSSRATGAASSSAGWSATSTRSRGCTSAGSAPPLVALAVGARLRRGRPPPFLPAAAAILAAGLLLVGVLVPALHGRPDPGRRPSPGEPRGRSSPPSSSSCCEARPSSSSTGARRTPSRASEARIASSRASAGATRLQPASRTASSSSSRA